MSEQSKLVQRSTVKWFLFFCKNNLENFDMCEYAITINVYMAEYF